MHTRFSILLASILLIMLFCGFSAAADKTARHPVVSEKGLYQVSHASQVDPVPLNTIHAWVVEVRDAQGKPVNDAQIDIDGGMPAHGHGLPTKPRVTDDLGDGRYLIDGLKFQMPGEWVIDLTISAGSGVDKARIDLSLGTGSDHSGHQH